MNASATGVHNDSRTKSTNVGQESRGKHAILKRGFQSSLKPTKCFQAVL